MRLLTSVLIALVFLCAPVASYSQTTIEARAAGAPVPAAIYPIPGSHLLQKQNEEVQAYIAQHPDALVHSNLLKSSWTFGVGSTRTWKAQNLLTKTFYDVPSTCRAVGTHCYIFVEDANWGSRVTQAGVDSVLNAFDNETPANSTKGVYQMDVDAFGTPPDIDGDSKIVILVLDIQDGFTGSGGFVAGYFWGGNEISGYPNGNNAEIYYVDANPIDLTSAWGVRMAMSTAAHEFQHMIHYIHDNNEITFINEGCSMFAESNCGYGIRSQSGYVNETNHYLLDWRDNNMTMVLNDYSRAARFTQYLGDQFGVGVFMPIVASTLNGIDGLDAGLASFGTSRRFADIFQDWLIANILDDGTVDPHYGYQYPDLAKAVGENYLNANVPLTRDTIYALAARYLSFTSGSDLRITFNTSSSDIVIKAVEIGSPSRVLNIAPGNEFHEAGFGTTYPEIHFVVMNTSQSASNIYSYQSSGGGTNTVELKYDDSEPAGYLDFPEGDTACVWFNGVPGAHLDSIRVALHATGSADGGVYLFTGIQRPTPLGSGLAVPITATRTGSSVWTKVDLHSYGLDAGEDFVVAFPYVGTSSTTPRVMVVDEPYTTGDVFHSYSYYNGNWYVITDGNAPGNAFAYSIRAYVSFGLTDTRESIELIPMATTLSPCYPNPFNPSTTIAYTVAGVRGQESGVGVRLAVYDVLGREVAVLVNEPQQAGAHTVHFDAKGLSSGTYIYRLVAGSHMESKKMVLMK